MICKANILKEFSMTADCFAASSARGSSLSNAFFWFRALLFQKKIGKIACSVAGKAPDAVAIADFADAIVM